MVKKKRSNRIISNSSKRRSKDLLEAINPSLIIGGKRVPRAVKVSKKRSLMMKMQNSNCVRAT